MDFANLTALRILALTALASALSAQTTRLELGKTVQGDLSVGETRDYSVTVDANQYLRADVTQPVAVVLIEFYAPDGQKVLEVDTRNFSSKPSRIVWATGTDGDYRVRLSVPDKTAYRSHFEIKLNELRAAEADDGKRVEAERFFTQGLSLAHTLSNDQAILAYTQALELYDRVGDREREGDTLRASGIAYRAVGQTAKAINYSEQALAIAREVKDRRGESNALSNLGTAYFDVSQYERAIGYWEQNLGITRELSDRPTEALALNTLGAAYHAIGQNEKAISYLEEALPIRRDIVDRNGEGVSLLNLGSAYMDLSRYEKAIGYWEQALAIGREIKHRGIEGYALGFLGNAYLSLSQYEQAIGHYEQALAIQREIKDRRGEGIALGSLGTAYMNTSQEEKAIGYFEAALAIDREIKYRRGEGMALGNLGEAYSHLSRHEKAIGYFEQALAIEREIRERDGEGLSLKNLGDSYNKLGQYEKATAYYAQALAISREVKDRHTEADELSALMETWQAAHRARLAIFYGKQAVNIVQSIRSDIKGLSQDLQQSFLKGNEKAYHTLAEILISQGRLAEAEQVLALLKEEEYFQYIRRDSTEASSLNRRADLTPEEAEYEKRYREIVDNLMTIGAERGDLLAKKTLSSDQSQRLVRLEQDLVVGNQAFEHFLGDLTQHFSAKPEITGRIETLRETQGIMEDLRELPAGTVAIFTLIGDDQFHTILRTPDAQKAYEYPIKAEDLNRKILEFREAVKNPNADPRPLAQELYKILIAGMADDLRQAKAKTLMWSLDGALRYVPLAALYDGKQYLIERYRLSVMTLASNARLKDRPDKSWKAAGFGATATLPAVASELGGIITTKPGDGGVLEGEIKLDDQFTQQSMRQALLKRYQVVHIASHFSFQPGNETKSFLLLGDGRHLTLAEMKTSANMFGGVQLLTLSACNTGVGDGAEVEGFGTLAQRQGAKAVVASLWPVADASTAVLMREFYRIRETNPAMTKLDALRQAQLELLHGKGAGAASNQRALVHEPVAVAAPQDFRHPYFWAPFFLMGNWL